MQHIPVIPVMLQLVKDKLLPTSLQLTKAQKMVNTPTLTAKIKPVTQSTTQRMLENQLEYSLDRDMSILVFNEHSSFCQKLKKVIWCIMLAKYANLLCPPKFKGGNQQEEYDLVQQAVHKLLKEGLFLQGGEDENGKCKNIAHPAIPAVIHEFFYTNKDYLAALYHQDFEHTVPDYAISLIQNCLEEYADYGYRKPITLDRDTYRVVMKHHLHLIDTLKGHEYHGARYEAHRAEWARKGMQLLEQDEAPVAHYVPCYNLTDN
ncbi:hypothetical protein BYT27DRAFT_7279305 [Phlegmacium glaucopus]|nr:hypothetical protein BYT27DRAFT_7279305 [Phlegmacium glaucopus]